MDRIYDIKKIIPQSKFKNSFKLVKSICKLTGMSKFKVFRLLWGVRGNTEKFKLFVISITGVMVGISYADGEFSVKEKELVFDNFLKSVLSYKEIQNLDFLEFIFLKPPNVDACIRHIKAAQKTPDYAMYDKIIENVSKTDGLFCEHEKKFIDEFRYKTGRIKTVPVVATMSSGKSTLINALLSTELLPSENQACTATVYKIENNTKIQQTHCRHLHKSTGISDWIPVSSLDIKELNKTDYVEVEILTSFEKERPKNVTFLDSIKEKWAFLKDDSLAPVHTVLYDTPGPNNSRDVSHAQITESILNQGNFGQIIVVLNAEQFGIDDEYDFLSSLSKLKQEKENVKIIFVLNKFDSLDPEKENIEEFYFKVKHHLENIGFKDAFVIPTMSKLALNIRTVIHHPDIFDAWSNRKKNSLLSALEFLDESNSIYESLLTKDEQNKIIMEKLRKQLAKNSTDQEFSIGDKVYYLSELKYLSIYTGIPLLEDVLNLKLEKI